jgi:pyridoxal phosphate enzyme (YggS family)
MASIAANLQRVRESVAEACRRAGREPSSVTLLAVSKTFPVQAVREAWEAGQRDFGESRQQEGGPKVAAMPDDCRWHFIGKLQRNKARKILADFPVIHSVGSLRLAETIDRIAGETGTRPEIFLEVNLAGEESKGGFSPEELRSESPTLAALPSIVVRGLMAIPPAADDPEHTRPWFRQLRELRDALERDWERPLPDLSMGMSGDYPVAIEEGSTLVRIGSAIFGNRPATAEPG